MYDKLSKLKTWAATNYFYYQEICRVIFLINQLTFSVDRIRKHWRIQQYSRVIRSINVFSFSPNAKIFILI